ncbi:MAG TPA: DUF4442 domain-containing protein [Flavobacteriaceae bacterium]|nr:DUF4442 domain-containing protein [Flavobacteriaceae bacterium]
MKPSTINNYLLLKLPLARIAGVKLSYCKKEEAQTRVKYRWLNQNPFKSMFWAVQGMAAELSTGALCTAKIKSLNSNISMLVVDMKGKFTKKAVGKIKFTCTQGLEVEEIIEKAILTGKSQTLEMKSVGIDEKGDQVSVFYFNWSFKLRT